MNRKTRVFRLLGIAHLWDGFHQNRIRQGHLAKVSQQGRVVSIVDLRFIQPNILGEGFHQFGKTFGRALVLSHTIFHRTDQNMHHGIKFMTQIFVGVL